MKRLAVVLAVAFLVATFAQTSSRAGQRSARSARQTDQAREASRARDSRDADTDEDFTENCQRLYEYAMTNYSSRQVAQDVQTLSRASVQVLDVEGSRNGGVSIKGWDKPDIMVKACKMAAADDDATAQALLSQLTISTEGGKIRAREPENFKTNGRASWVVQFLIFVPHDLSVEASVHNGGLALTRLTGAVNGRSQNGGIAISRSGSFVNTIELHAINGGIALSDVEGKINAHTNNGGISMSRSSGEVKLESQNGGITLRLPDGGWVGQSLEARTQNGGLVLQVPAGFNSGIEAETSGHSRIDCRLPDCPQELAAESDGRPRRVQLGSASPVVHVSTRNGSVQIMQSK
jgi:DUF4097 and DUF4098 domain-containing protein YvlB